MVTHTKVLGREGVRVVLVGLVIVACAMAVSAGFFGGIASAHSDGPADGMMVPATMTEMKPGPGETHHLEVKVETLEGFRIPDMEIAVTATPQGGGTPIEKELDGMFGSNFHYGVGMALEPKQYLLTFHLDPPTFMREGKRASQWLELVDAEFVFDAGTQTSGVIGTKELADMKIIVEAEEPESMYMMAEGAGGHMETMVDQQVPVQKSSGSSLALIGVLGLIVGFILGRFVFAAKEPAPPKG